MYNLNDKQIDTLTEFVDCLEESMVKSKAKVIVDKVASVKRITAELLESFLSLAIHFPKEKQNFPQSFALALRTGTELEIAEDGTDEEVKEIKKEKDTKKKGK